MIFNQTEKPGIAGLFCLLCRYVFIKEVFKLFGSKHLINDFKDGSFVLLIELLDKLHLLHRVFIFNGYFPVLRSVVDASCSAKSPDFHIEQNMESRVFLLALT